MDVSSQSSSPRNGWLVAGGAASLGLAVLHVAIILVGARGYAWFGAGNLAVMALRGSLYPPFITALITFVFLLWAAFAFSGAGLLPRLPLLRVALVSITLIYGLRGLVVVLDILRLVGGAPYPPRHAAFSATALIIGILHGAGTERLLFHRHRQSAAA